MDQRQLAGRRLDHGAGTDDNVVAGNYIGTDVTGNDRLAQRHRADRGTRKTDLTGDGISIEAGASDNVIGTSGSSVDNAGDRNVISGNDNDGVEIGGSGTSGNLVAGNYIGLDHIRHVAVAITRPECCSSPAHAPTRSAESRRHCGTSSPET